MAVCAFKGAVRTIEADLVVLPKPLSAALQTRKAFCPILPITFPCVAVCAFEGAVRALEDNLHVALYTI